MTRVVVVTTRVADDHERSLTPRERACLSSAAVPKRRAEFAAGRAAAHRALHLLAGDVACSIVRAPEGEQRGAPIVVDDDGAPAPFAVSISHAGGIAIAVAAPASLQVGVDVVHIEPLGDAWRAESFVDGELAAWAAFLDRPARDDVVAAVAFAAKECALKIERIGFGAPLLGVRVAPRAAPPPEFDGLPPDARGLAVEWTAGDRAGSATGAWVRSGALMWMVVTCPTRSGARDVPSP